MSVRRGARSDVSVGECERECGTECECEGWGEGGCGTVSVTGDGGARGWVAAVGSSVLVAGSPSIHAAAESCGLWTRMAGRDGRGPSNSIWMETAGEGATDSVGVEGAEGYD